jgi:membrane-bound metal-dependent hydrolase YbcI (DUF457 family)
MPTPVGHALGGLAFGWLLASNANPNSTPTLPSAPSLVQQLRAGWRRAALFATLGALPDIDLLFHAHSTYTHSLGAALSVSLIVLAVAPAPRTRFALACGAAYASHVLLDWLGTDTSPPYGITALWPFSSSYFYSAIDLFPVVDRRYWLPGFWQRDVIAIFWELLILVPFTLIIIWLRRQRRPHA